MNAQLALAGIEPGAPKKRKLSTRSPQRVENRRRGWRPTFLGVEIPVPTDLLGQELAMGPYRVLRTVRGQLFVMDYRRPLGEGTVFEGDLRACVVWMVAHAKKS